MSHSKRVAKNSIWLIIHPLILNMISLFVIGYIARCLGKADYGKFVFAFSFILMFMPIINMGIGSITTREITENRPIAPELLGKLIPLRIFLAVIAIFLVVISINIMGYPIDSKIVVYMAAMTLIFYSLTITFHSVFQGLEKMEYIAYVQFVSGFILTFMSVVVLFLGFRLIGLTQVYYFGSFIGMCLCCYYILKVVSNTHIKIDLLFWKMRIIQGIPFFLPGLLTLLGTRIGIVILSKVAGDSSVGIYGAANSLVERLSIIPDGICTAIFPAISAVFKASKEDASHLFKKFYWILFLIGMPISVGTSILAVPMINLIYGSEYVSASLVLQLLVWGLFFTFLNLIQTTALGAIHYEKKAVIASFVATPCSIIFGLILIPLFKESGAGMASLIVNIISFYINYRFIKKYLIHDGLFKDSSFFKAVSCSLVMGSVVYFLRHQNIFIAVISGIIVYAVMILYLKLVSINDIKNLAGKRFSPGEA